MYTNYKLFKESYTSNDLNIGDKFYSESSEKTLVIASIDDDGWFTVYPDGEEQTHRNVDIISPRDMNRYLNAGIFRVIKKEE